MLTLRQKLQELSGLIEEYERGRAEKNLEIQSLKVI